MYSEMRPSKVWYVARISSRRSMKPAICAHTSGSILTQSSGMTPTCSLDQSGSLVMSPSSNSAILSSNGMFYVAPRVSTTPLEQLFRVRVIRMLVEEELLAPELARKLLSWKHSGFSVHNGKPLRREDAAGLERVAQYTRLQRCSTAGRFLTPGPGFSYGSVRNRGRHMVRQVC